MFWFRRNIHFIDHATSPQVTYNDRNSKVWLTDRPFYSPGFEVGAKNWSISRVQHWLNNFGPFAKVLAVDGQTWHSLQSDIRHAWSESLRSQHQAIPGRVCRPTGNISLNEQRQTFSGDFLPSDDVRYLFLNQLINKWIFEITKVETPRSKVSTDGLHSKSIIEQQS